jgi:hypothetical protein
MSFAKHSASVAAEFGDGHAFDSLRARAAQTIK